MVAASGRREPVEAVTRRTNAFGPQRTRGARTPCTSTAAHPRRDPVRRPFRQHRTVVAALPSHGMSTESMQDIEPGCNARLAFARERNQALMLGALPVVESLYEQIVDTQSMVVLTDASGFILHSRGDARFIDRASRVALAPGVEWSEEGKGTNAIGTALMERAPVVVNGPEHYLTANHFLTCSAAPILDPKGDTIGVLDVTGDYRAFNRHTMALVKMSVQMIENHLLGDAFPDAVEVRIHSRPEFLGTLCEGILAFDADGNCI